MELRAFVRRPAGCPIQGMNLALIVFLIQVVVVLAALVRERGEDAAFQGDKLGYRS